MMKLLRETIRRLIRESISNSDNPNMKMLADLNNSSDFHLISSGADQFPNGPQAMFQWGDDPCLYEINLSANYDDIIFIETIEAVAPFYEEGYNDMCEGQGYGSDMMYELMEFADNHDVQLSLVADAFHQTDDDRRPDTAALTAWYKRLGFEDSPQSNGMLVYNFRS